MSEQIFFGCAQTGCSNAHAAQHQNYGHHVCAALDSRSLSTVSMHTDTM